MWHKLIQEGMISSLAIKERTDLFGFMADRGRVHDHFLYLSDSGAASQSALQVERASANSPQYYYMRC